MAEENEVLCPTRQQVLDAGLNLFAFDLVAESFLGRTNPEDPQTLKFRIPCEKKYPGLKGVVITLEPELEDVHTETVGDVPRNGAP